MYSTRTVNDTFALLCLERGEKAGHAPQAHTKGFTAQPVLATGGGWEGARRSCLMKANDHSNGPPMGPPMGPDED